MAAGKEFNATDYIQHHLTFLTKPVGDGGFWSLNVDTVITSILVGLLAMGSIWWVVRGATSGVPLFSVDLTNAPPPPTYGRSQMLSLT